MEFHTGLITFLKKTEEDQKALVYLGSIKTHTSAVVCLEIKKDDNNNNFNLNVVDAEEDITFLVFEYTDKENYDENLKMITDDFENVLEQIHNKIIGCLHCGRIFSDENELNIEYGFKDKSLCSDCGLQNLYDKKFGDEKCSICLEAIGFGEFVSICGDVKHKIHVGCGKTLTICPLCRKSQYEEEEIQFVVRH